MRDHSKKSNFLACVLGFFFLFSLPVQAQDSSLYSQSEGSYLLPQTVFVGDRGRLVIPLGQAFVGVEPFLLETPEKLPETPDLLIRRIELERRGDNSRLLIDFIPYAPGILSLPPIELSSITLTGLEVQVASILNSSQMTLSEPALPLAMPGTSLLIYGTLVLILLFFSLGAVISFWGRRHFRELWERLRRRRLLRGMTKFLRQLRQGGILEKNNAPGSYLSFLSTMLRDFLSQYTGLNCRSLSAGEFLDLPLGGAGDAEENVLENAMKLTGAESFDSDAFKWSPYLCCLFRSWDTLRFSGRDIMKTDLFQALKDTETFIAALDRAEKEKPLIATEGL